MKINSDSESIVLISVPSATSHSHKACFHRQAVNLVENSIVNEFITLVLNCKTNALKMLYC